MADQGLTLRILVVFVLIVTVLLFVRHYQKSRRLDRFAQNPFATLNSSDIYIPASSQRAGAGTPAEVLLPYDQGVPFYTEKQATAQAALQKEVANQQLQQRQLVPDAASMSTVSGGGMAPTQGSDPVSNEVFRAVDYPVNSPPNNLGCFPRDKVTAQDLLPKDAANSTWSKVMPAGQGDVSNQNFLTAGYQIGVNSSVMRNPNYGLRSEPPNPQVVVSPWQNSTIDPDMMRRPLELASAPVC